MDFISIDDKYLKRLMTLGQVPPMVGERMLRLLWNRRDFQSPVREIREWLGIDPLRGLAVTAEAGENAYQNHYFPSDGVRGEFPAGFEEKIGALFSTLVRANQIVENPHWEQFVRSLTYFGLIDKHPEFSEYVELDPNKYIQFNDGQGEPRAIEYQDGEDGFFIRIYPGTTQRDIAALFKSERFQDLKGRSVTLQSSAFAFRYRSLALIIDEMEEGYSEGDLISAIKENDETLYKSLGGLEFSVAKLEDYKSRARRQGFLC